MITVKTFQRYCGSGLCTPKYHLFEHMMVDRKRIQALSVFDTGPYQHFNV